MAQIDHLMNFSAKSCTYHYSNLFLLKEMLLNDFLKGILCVCSFLYPCIIGITVLPFFSPGKSLKKIPGVPCWNGNFG
jgi:hypothetical protein